MRHRKTTEEEREYMKVYYNNNKDRLTEYKKLSSKKNTYSTEEWQELYCLYLKKYQIGLFKAKKQLETRGASTRYDKGPKIKTMSREIKTTTVSFD